MKKLNNYIVEAWSGVKKQSHEQEIKLWCEEMRIQNYTINSKGEIDVDGFVNLDNKSKFKELPYKFGKVTGNFSLISCINLISLKNCPNEVGGYFNCAYCNNLKSIVGSPSYVGEDFACSYCPQLDSLEGCPKKIEDSFYCHGCKSLDSLEGCPKKVGGDFWCVDCKRKFTKEEVMSLCKVTKDIFV